MNDKLRNLYSRYKKTTKVSLISLGLMLFVVLCTSMFGTVHKLNKIANNMSDLDMSQYIEEAEIIDKVASVLGFLSGTTAIIYVLLLIVTVFGLVLPILLATCVNRLILSCAISSLASEKRYRTIKFVTLFIMILTYLPAIWLIFNITPVILSSELILKYTYHVLALIFITATTMILNFVLIIKETI